MVLKARLENAIDRLNPTVPAEAREEAFRKIINIPNAIDWTKKESVQAKLRIYVRRLLEKYHYPPDKQERATKTVLDQAELMAGDWSDAEE